MNQLFDSHQRPLKRRTVLINDGLNSMKRPKLSHLNVIDDPNKKKDIFTDIKIDYDKHSKSFFQSYFEKISDDKMITDSISNTKMNSLYDKYLREMKNYKQMIHNTKGPNISKCCQSKR